MNATLRWDKGHWPAVITDGQQVIEMTLDTFKDLPAVRYVTELALEKADLLHRPIPRPVTAAEPALE